GTQIDRNPVWALPAAVTFGVTAAAIGAWRRLAAPLVAGTAITAATTFVAMGSDLRAVPTWMWLALGGVALLGIAVLIERTSQHGTTLRDLTDRWN
ncbi:MAG: hypothetical protein KDB37_23865, partial [Ilumatobacter sp.]|nr:hypothetical protein [Ilumatobacter sp.]